MAEEFQPIATLLVGAEGAALLDDKEWARPANDDEKHVFIQRACKSDGQIFRNSLVDQDGRPYFLMTVLENAPEEVQVKARSYCRCLRLTIR
jgi:hypothetical protein